VKSPMMHARTKKESAWFVHAFEYVNYFVLCTITYVMYKPCDVLSLPESPSICVQSASSHFTAFSHRVNKLTHLSFVLSCLVVITRLLLALVLGSKFLAYYSFVIFSDSGLEFRSCKNFKLGPNGVTWTMLYIR
jgi:hypothetical protein